MTRNTPANLDDFRELLQMWLSYEEQRHDLTARLYSVRGEPGRIELLLDENERLGQRVRRLTRELLDRPHPPAN